MLAEVLVGEEAHGVAEVELAEVVAAVGGVEVVHAERARVVGGDVLSEPAFEGMAVGVGKIDAGGYLTVGKEVVVLIDSVGRSEKGEADEAELAMLHIVFEGELVGHVAARFGEDTALRTYHLLQPEAVVVAHLVGDPAEAATRARPRGFENEGGMLEEELGDLVGGDDGAGIGLEGEDGGAVLEGAEGGEVLVGGEQTLGDVLLEEGGLEGEVPAPGNDFHTFLLAEPLIGLAGL